MNEKKKIRCFLFVILGQVIWMLILTRLITLGTVARGWIVGFGKVLRLVGQEMTLAIAIN